MPVNPANIRQVRETYEGPEGPNPFLSLLQGGVEGYFGRKAKKEQLPIEMFKSIAPALANTGKLRPTRPGETGMIPGITEGNWTYASQQIPGYEGMGGIDSYTDAKIYEQTQRLKAMNEGKINRLQASDQAWKIILNSPGMMAKSPQEQTATHQMVVKDLMKGQEGEQLSEEDRQAIQWIEDNPDDPRTAAVAKKLRAKGIKI